MKRLWAPWRMQYIKKAKEGGCILCEKPKEDRDKENYILYRSAHSFVMLNTYPYNNGHLMVSPYAHSNSLEALSDDILLDMFKVTSLSTSVLKAAFSPEGFNIGMNLGKTAGAGIDDHLHIHIVPRWNGDTSYMPVISETRVLPEHLMDTYQKILPHFECREKP